MKNILSRIRFSGRGKVWSERDRWVETGSSGRAGFNYSSTAKRQDTRLVEIVMGFGLDRPDRRRTSSSCWECNYGTGI